MGTMGIYAWILSIATILVAIALIIVVMLQSDKSSGAGVVTGNNTFYNSNKSKTLDGLLSRLTVILGILFAILCVLTTVSIMK